MQNEIIQLSSAEKRDCDCCSASATVRMSYAVQKFNYGAEEPYVELSVRVPVWTCAECGDQYTDEKAEEIRHEEVCRHLQRMTPSDIKCLREMYGLTQANLAELTGFGVASIKRWEGGSLVQGLAQDRFMRLLLDRRTMLALQDLVSKPAGYSGRMPRFRTELSEEAVIRASSF